MVTTGGGFCHAGFLPQMMEQMPGDKDMWQPSGKAKLELSEQRCGVWGCPAINHLVLLIFNV